MPPKKKAIRNAFYYFMIDFRKKKELSGMVFQGGMREVAEMAGPVWSSMNVDQKDHYNKLAAKARKRDNEDLTKKFTSLGVSYADLDAEERENEEAYQLMVETVRNMITSLSRDESLRREVFYLCHVNYFYKSDKGIYYPAELALAEFNLEEGIINKFHTFINPGKLELGFRFEATDWSQKTHNIPIDDPNWTVGEKDYKYLFNRVLSFLKVRDPYNIPPVFTMPDSLNNNTSLSAARSLFMKLAEAGGLDATIFRIYPLPQLFYELRNHCVDDTHEVSGSDYKYLPTVALAENEMEKDIFTYAKNLGCDYHEDKDLATFCSLSIVIRWVYTICDHCCSLLGIELMHGHHCPMDADINRTLSFKKPPRNNTCKSTIKVEQIKDSKTNSFMPTIIDHGKLREQIAQQGAAAHSSTLVEDVRLPRKAMYSTATKQNKGLDPAPRLNSRDFPEMVAESSRAETRMKPLGRPGGDAPPPFTAEPLRAESKPRSGFGRGRGISRNMENGEFGNWPVSGRGSRPF